MDFEGFVNDIVTNRWEVYGVEVYRDGKLCHSYGDTEENLHMLYSATKSILSIALGIVYDMGRIDLDSSILTYLPKKHVDIMSEKQRRTFEKISVKRLLTMSVGDIPFAIDREWDSWIDYALSCEIANPDERTINYSNINSYLIGVALSEIIGGDLFAFIEERILQPLGISRYSCGRCPEGYFYGASEMQLTVHDLSKIGLLLYQRGVWDGHRIVSEEYIDLATSVHQTCREGGYGFFFWKYRDGFSINGKLKQKCYILPKEGIVVTYLSHIEDPGDDLKRSMERRILDWRKMKHIEWNYQDNEQLRASFNELAGKVFGLNFEGWYQNGFWKDNYIPYSMVEDGKVVANVSVNRCDMVFDGKVVRLIQLGTVMTDPDYRGKGYAGALMKRILDDYKDKVDGIYLYANDSVREFYPKYGFKERTEYQFSKELSDKSEASKKPVGKAVAFSMNGKQDWDKMEEILRNKAQNSRVYMVNNTGLYMFYLSQFMQENVFYLPDSDTYVIAEKEEDTLILHAVIGDGGIDEVIAALRGDAKRVVLMFTPKNPAGFTKQELHEEDTTFFVQGKFFEENDSEEFMFQAVTHA